MKYVICVCVKRWSAARRNIFHCLRCWFQGCFVEPIEDDALAMRCSRWCFYLRSSSLLAVSKWLCMFTLDVNWTNWIGMSTLNFMGWPCAWLVIFFLQISVSWKTHSSPTISGTHMSCMSRARCTGIPTPFSVLYLKRLVDPPRQAAVRRTPWQRIDCSSDHIRQLQITAAHQEHWNFPSMGI